MMTLSAFNRSLIPEVFVAGALMFHLLSQSAHGQTTVTVSTATQLQSAVSAANGAGGNRTILLTDGTYTLTDTLYVNAPGVTIAGQSGDRSRVIVQGDAMSASATVKNLIRVAANNITVRDLTLQRAGWHLVQVAGEANADSPVFTNLILRDSYQQMLKVTGDSINSSDSGLVENSLFEYSAGVGPQYYIGGIDAHRARNWTVKGNTFRSIISPSGSSAEFAVHFWDSSANNLIERNLIINCDRGIGFGMQNSPNSGGIIRNNMIYHAANRGAFADVAIALAESPNSQVYNNSILDESFSWAIEYRFSSTQGVLIANNVTNKPISSRDGGSATVANNVTTAASSWFVNPQAGDLHLASAVTAVMDKGQVIAGLNEDFDGQARPNGTGIDVGADEYGATQVKPRAPTDMRAL